jgi:hypothetical protein
LPRKITYCKSKPIKTSGSNEKYSQVLVAVKTVRFSSKKISVVMAVLHQQ